jgi:hypothetical protein
MVTLFVSDLEQVTMLEYVLMRSNIEYTKQLDDGRYGILTPYIKVYEVPLDEQRAFNWIKEKIANE